MCVTCLARHLFLSFLLCSFHSIPGRRLIIVALSEDCSADADGAASAGPIVLLISPAITGVAKDVRLFRSSDVLAPSMF